MMVWQVADLLSNVPEVLYKFPNSEWACELYSEVISSCERVLGVSWCLKTDQFIFSFDLKDRSKEHTRRTVLSLTASIYDPLGLIAPVILPAKLILQSSCVEGLGWDDLLPVHLSQAWSRWLLDMRETRISVPRCVIPGDVDKSDGIQLCYISYM